VLEVGLGEGGDVGEVVVGEVQGFHEGEVEGGELAGEFVVLDVEDLQVG
jgi:hypothetical protein